MGKITEVLACETQWNEVPSDAPQKRYRWRPYAWDNEIAYVSLIQSFFHLGRSSAFKSGV